jgi:hypothetical protein
MAGNQYKVRQAHSTWQYKYKDRPDIRVASLFAPDPELSKAGKVTLCQNFTSISNFTDTILKLSDSGSGDENTYDAISLGAQLFNNTFSLTWTIGSKKAIIVVTDEPGQSAQLPPGATYTVNGLTRQINQMDVIQYVTSQPEKVRVFVFTRVTDWQTKTSFANIVTQTGGIMYDIDSDASTMANSLDEILRIITCE